jgi:hypothetical protein
MPKLIMITPEKIEKVKDLLKRNTIRGAARYAGISFYSAWHISKGTYDSPDPIPVKKKELFSKCPVTGW